MAIPTSTTTIRSAAEGLSINWAVVMANLKASFSDKVNEWIANARIDADWAKNTGTIIGDMAAMLSGSLVSTVAAPVPGIRQALLTCDGVTLDIAAALAEEVWHAWTEWAAGYHVVVVSVPNWGKFKMYDGAETPPTPMCDGVWSNQFLKIPLYYMGGSNGEARLSVSQLSTHILNRLRPLLGTPSSGSVASTSSAAGISGRSSAIGSGARRAIAISNAAAPQSAAMMPATAVAKGMLALGRTLAAGNSPAYNVSVISNPLAPAEAAVNELANWINEKFNGWKSAAKLSNLWGQGNVLAPAQPPASAGMVGRGKIWGSNVLSGPAFPWQ
jgi:hypothetical protein